VLYLHVTTHIKDRKNEDLFGKKGGQGFPTFMFLDSKGGVLSMQPGALDVERMTGLHDKAKERHAAYVELEKQAAAGDEKAKVKLALMQVELTHKTFADFRKAYPDFSKLDEDVRGQVMGLWGNATFQEAMAKFSSVVGRDRTKVPDGAKAAAPIIFAAAKEGAEPSGRSPRLNWYAILGMGGTGLENAEMLKLAIKGLKTEAETNPQLGNMVDGFTSKLKELEGGSADAETEDAEEETDEDEEEMQDDN